MLPDRDLFLEGVGRSRGYSPFTFRTCSCGPIVDFALIPYLNALPRRAMRTHYQNLKVDEKAPLSVIKAAYKALALEYHPDRRKDDPEAERIFKLFKSHNVLYDPDKRRAHDEWIKSSREEWWWPQSRHSTKPARCIVHQTRHRLLSLVLP